MRVYKFLATVFNMKRDRELFDEDPRLLQRSVSAFQRVAPLALRHADRFHSQFGQDILVAEVLMPGQAGVFLDVGARCGVINSNSLALESAYGWRGLLVEPERTNFANILTARTQPARHMAVSDVSDVLEFVSFSEERGHSKLRKLVRDEELARRAHEVYAVDVRPIGSILRESGIAAVDYVDIDVEGEELAAIRGMDFDAVEFRFIAVESNPSRYRQIRDLLAARDFVPLCRLGVDVFFVRASEFEQCCDRLESPA
jgi:FkbM family methyltransferase